MSSADSALPTTLRAITPADNEFLYRLYASTRAAEMALVNWSDAQVEDFLRMQFHAQSTHYIKHFPDTRFDLIELDGEPIGRLYVDEREDAIHIIDIALLPHYQGRGIGGGYLQSMIDQAHASQRKVSIHVERNNPAMKLYQRLGFRRVKDEGVYWLMQWQAHSQPV
jgi:ribosomal protein S18 acetylase RimI-like enzyme